MLDIEMLRIIWWLLLGVLFIGFAITDGFDLGVAILSPFVAKTDMEKRIVINSIGPVWEGNQVWIILGAGAIFAAWPYVYAVAFSGAYLAVLLLLLTLGISRPIAIKYRSKSHNIAWRRVWDAVFFIGGFVPAILFGVLVGNILLGLPFYFDSDLRINYSGTLLDLLSPFALWCGITSLFMLTMHGGLYLAIKTTDPIRERAIFYSRIATLLLIIFFIGGGFWIAFYVMGYQVISGADHFGYSNPLFKEVIAKVGGWLDNYERYPITMLIPLIGFLGAIMAFLTARRSHVAFFFSSLSIIGIIGTVGISMFPFILPSSINLGSSLLVWDASSTRLTLLIMLLAVFIFIPLITIYTSWVYFILRGKVSSLQIDKDQQSY